MKTSMSSFKIKLPFKQMLVELAAKKKTNMTVHLEKLILEDYKRTFKNKLINE